MVRIKHVYRKEKRKALSTHSSQDGDSHPRKAVKPSEGESDEGSSIEMINSSNLRRYRKNQRQCEQLAAQGQDEWTNPRGLRPPRGSKFQRQPYTAPQPNANGFYEEGGEYEEGFETSYGGNDSEERDHRISGWAESVAGAGAEDLGIQSSSPRPSEVADAHDGDEEDEDDENAAEEEDVVPSIETTDARPRAGAVARTRTAVRAQLPNQTLRRSARLLHQNPQVFIARIPQTHSDPAAHLNKPVPDVRNLSNKYTQGHAGIIACTTTDFKARRQAFFDNSRPDTQKAAGKPLSHGNFESLGHVFESNGASPKSGEESCNNTVDTSSSASKQNAAIRYSNRDHLAKHGHVFASNDMSENSSNSSSHHTSNHQPFHNRDWFQASSPNHESFSNSRETSNCVFADCPCHHTAALGLPRRHVIHTPEGAYNFHPTGSSTSFSKAESHHDGDYCLVSGYEQQCLDYGSEPREDRDNFPMQTCVLDYDGDAQMKQELASEAGGSEEKGDREDENGEADSGYDDYPDAGENDACNERSDSGNPEGGEQEMKSEPSDSSSDNSEEDMESVQRSENPVVGEEENVGEEGNAEEDKSGSENNSDYASVQANNNTAAIPWRNTDPGGRIRPPQSQDDRLVRRGGLSDAPFGGPQTRQNTTANRARNEQLSPVQGYVSVSIAEW